MAKNQLRRRRPRRLLVAGTSIALGLGGCGSTPLPFPTDGGSPDLACSHCGGNAFCPPGCWPQLDYSQTGSPYDIGNFFPPDTAPSDDAAWVIDNGMPHFDFAVGSDEGAPDDSAQPPPDDLAGADMSCVPCGNGWCPKGCHGPYDLATSPDAGARD